MRNVFSQSNASPAGRCCGAVPRKAGQPGWRACWSLWLGDHPIAAIQCSLNTLSTSPPAFLQKSSSAVRKGPCRLPVGPSPAPGVICFFCIYQPVSLVQRNPVFPPSWGTCPGRLFRGEFKGVGEERGFAQAVLRAAADVPQNSPVIPVPKVHGSSASFLPSRLQESALAAARVISIFQLAALSDSSPSLRGLGLDPGRAACAPAEEDDDFIFLWQITDLEIKSGEMGIRGGSPPAAAAAWAFVCARGPILSPSLGRWL